MKTKGLISIFSIVLFSLIGLSISAQETDSIRYQSSANEPFELEKAEKEKREPIQHDLRIGIDLHNYILGAISPYRTGIDLSLEYNVTSKIYVLLEGGYNYYKKENVRIEYVSQGNYIRTGIDYNLRETEGSNDRDIYYVGFRYGYSRFQQEVPRYLLLNDYWGNSTLNKPPEDGFAHWAELLTGFKVEVIKNWYLGMGLRLKFFIHRSKTGIEPVQYVPGYSQNYNSAVMDFNYTLSYNIPLNYKKKKLAINEQE